MVTLNGLSLPGWSCQVYWHPVPNLLIILKISNPTCKENEREKRGLGIHPPPFLYHSSNASKKDKIWNKNQLLEHTVYKFVFLKSSVELLMDIKVLGFSEFILRVIKSLLNRIYSKENVHFCYATLEKSIKPTIGLSDLKG